MARSRAAEWQSRLTSAQALAKDVAFNIAERDQIRRSAGNVSQVRPRAGGGCPLCGSRRLHVEARAHSRWRGGHAQLNATIRSGLGTLEGSIGELDADLQGMEAAPATFHMCAPPVRKRVRPHGCTHTDVDTLTRGLWHAQHASRGETAADGDAAAAQGARYAEETGHRAVYGVRV